ncbi:MAG: hypothetical protein ACRETW_12515 [Stenotrophobium sp.]
MSTRIVLIAALGLGLAACGGSEPPPPPKAPPQGRAETQGIRNTDAIGYAGSGIANKVDSALDANDNAKKKMDDALQQQEQSPPPPTQ